MGVFRTQMDRILDDLENSIVITNPKERGRTFLRKILYKTLSWLDRIGKWFQS